MHSYTDIHTHAPGRPRSILSIPFAEVERMRSECRLQSYSLQLHPWHLTGNADIEAFVAYARAHRDDPQFVAIGECGLDPLCDVPLPLQHAAFLAALRLAHELHKPLVIHCVRLWDQLLADVRQVLPLPADRLQLPLIVHGFRKGPQLARQLLDAGFSISLGLHYNEATRQVIPPERLYFETD